MFVSKSYKVPNNVICQPQKYFYFYILAIFYIKLAALPVMVLRHFGAKRVNKYSEL